METEDFLEETNIYVIQDALASILQNINLIKWHEVRARLVASKVFVLIVVATNYGFVANAAHDRHEHFYVAILATYLLLETRLQEGVKALGSNLRLTFAVQDAQKIEFVDPERQLRVLFHALVLPVLVFLVLEVDENVILHQ